MSIYDKLNEQQKLAVVTTEGPVLILAGAGSGKTSVLTHRVAYLLDEVGVNPYNILAITFTNKAAGEMRERVDSLVGMGAEQIFISTFHSMCVRILRRFADCLGYDNRFTIYDTDDQKQVIKDVCKKLDIDTKKLKERTIINYISSAKDELINPVRYATINNGDVELRKVAAAYAEYQSQLFKNNAMDFDDLLMKTVELFSLHPDILESYRERWQYIMVDEYQDTNTAQFELIRLLAGSKKNLCVVGDDDQSIYKFRGANIRNILDFERVYPSATVIKLEQNYRSKRNILDAANSVIRNNSQRKEKSLWSKMDEGERIHFRQFDNASEESEYICDVICKSVKSGKSLYKDNAVLYRTNAQSRQLEEYLVNRNVPYKIVGGVNFYSRREIKDILAYLKTVDNGSDDLAVKRILNVPKRGIGATTINKVQDFADSAGMSFFDALCNCEEVPGINLAAREKLKSFSLMMLRFRTFVEERSISECFDEILSTTEYIDKMDVDTDDELKDRIANIGEFKSKIVSFEEDNPDGTLAELLADIALIADIDSVDGQDDRTLLMTIHAAKGLEFRNVYLIGMEDGLFPSYMSIVSGDEEIQEERRLAYVGITRAKESLTLTSVRARMIHGETQYNPISRFVREIPNNLFDIAPLGGKRTSQSYDDDDDFSFSRSNRDEYENDYGYKRGYNNQDYGFSRNNEANDRGFSGFKRERDEVGSGFSDYAGFKRTADSSNTRSPGGVFRPSLVTPQKKTSDDNKPFIARNAGISGLIQGKNIIGGKLEYGVGDRVRHIKFGDGVVAKIEHEAKDEKVTVSFDSYGIKVMYASFAKLKKI